MADSMLDNTAEIMGAGKQGKEKAAKKAAPVLSSEHAKVKETLDALQILRKTVGQDNPAVVAIEQQLVDAVANAGGVVARGNTIYMVQDDALVTIDMTPGKLVRV